MSLINLSNQELVGEKNWSHESKDVYNFTNRENKSLGLRTVFLSEHSNSVVIEINQNIKKSAHNILID